MVVFVVGLNLGWRFREYQAEQEMNRMLKMVEKAATEKPPAMNVDLHAEGGMFYIYDSETGKFLTQVTDHDSLVEFFQKNFPDKNILMKKSDIDLLLKVE